MKLIKFLLDHHVVRYIISGGTGAVTNLGILFILTHFVGLYYLISGIIAFCVAVFVSFYMQKKWTFQDHTTEETHKKFGIFITIAIINLALNTALLFFFTDICHVYYLISQILASGIVAIWSYFLYKKIFVL